MTFFLEVIPFRTSYRSVEAYNEARHMCRGITTTCLFVKYQYAISLAASCIIYSKSGDGSTNHSMKKNTL